MTMNCYRFPSREQFRALAADEDLLTEDDTLIISSHTFAIDEIGVITKGGAWDPETGEQLEPPTLLDGWHVNTVGLEPDAWEAYAVTPLNPVRVFA